MRPVRSALLAAITLALVASGGVVGAAAAAPAPQRPATVHVSGVLRVVPVEGVVGPETYAYSVLTSDGAAVPVTAGPATAGAFASARSGALVVGEATIPASIVAGIPSATPSARAFTAAALHLAQTTHTPLPFTVASLQAPRTGAVETARPHVLNVAVASIAGTPTTVSDADVARIISNLSEFWVAETAGQITGITRAGSIKRLSFATSEDCDSIQAWPAAAAAFGRTEQSYYDGSDSQLTHLLVLGSPDCYLGPGNGLGSIGDRIHYGGEAWAVIDPGTDENQVVAHEIGHNISLDHSNLRDCSGHPTVFDADASCTIDEYGDYYDVMAGGYSYTFNGVEVANTDHLAALDVTHRVQLGTLQAGVGLQEIHLDGAATTTAATTIAPASATSGIRGVHVTDDRTGYEYYLEYRSGTGRDAGSYYTQIPPYYADFGNGVRILRMDAGTSSVALTTTASTEAGRKRFLASGVSQSTDSQGVKVTVNSLSASGANVTIQLKPLDLSAVDVARVAGPDRYAVGVALSQRTFPTGAQIVYVATGANYPDALAAGPAAAVNGGPVLLTPGDYLPQSLADEITRLHPARIVVAGGPNSVSDAVFQALKRLQPNTARIAGADRFAAGRALVSDAFTRRAPISEAFIATGLNFPDALSAGAVAGGKGEPVILLNGKAGMDDWFTAVDDATTGLMTDLGIQNTVIVGGENSVNPNVEFKLWASGFNPLRYAGADRYAASANLNAAFFTHSTEVYLATGTGFADALAAAAVAGRAHAPLFVVPKECVPLPVLRAIGTLGATKVTLVGGPASLSPNVESLTRC